MTTAAAFPPRLPSTCIVCCRIIRNKSLNMLRLERKHIFARQIFMFKITRASQSHKNLYTFLLRACWMCTKKINLFPFMKLERQKKSHKIVKLHNSVLANENDVVSPNISSLFARRHRGLRKIGLIFKLRSEDGNAKPHTNQLQIISPPPCRIIYQISSELINWSSFKRQPACHLGWNSIGIN